jgi:hypothetical protein
MKKEIKNFSEKYHLRLSAHPNQLATDLLKSLCVKRLKRFNPSDLINDLTHIDPQETCKVKHC